MRKIFILALALIGQYVSSVAQTNTFPIDGSVGIGTTSPVSKLDVLGHTISNGFALSRNNINRYALWFANPNDLNHALYNNYSDIDGEGSWDGLKINSYAGLNIRISSARTSALFVDHEGKVGLGTMSPSDKLSVNGKIRAKEVKVEAVNWPDYVFEDGYELKGLEGLERFIKENKHLPEMPSAAEVKEKGIELGDINAKILRKIEELTLYLIEKDKQFNEQQKQIKKLEEINMKLLKILNIKL